MYGLGNDPPVVYLRNLPGSYDLRKGELPEELHDVSPITWVWSPTRRIQDAWELVEELRKEMWDYDLCGANLHHACILPYCNPDSGKHKATADHPALAICLAYLKTKGILE